MQELIGVISCFLLIHMKDQINHLAVMMEAEVGVVQYQKLQQKNHYNRFVQP